MAEPKVSMKLLIDTYAKHVVFAEASKDCVDFLFYILSLPVAKVVSLLKKQGMVGSLGNLYESIENLNDTYVQPNQTKDNLLNPKLYGSSSVPLLKLKKADEHKNFYKCGGGYGCTYISDDPSAICPNCNKKMTTSMYFLAPQPSPAQQVSNEGGFVKGVVTYMVMDDLVVKPMSSISSITLLNKFHVKDVRNLEEKVVNLGMGEAVQLLKASLQSKTVLTDVFLKATN